MTELQKPLKISVTEVGKCPMYWAFQRDNCHRAPMHYATLKGIIVHSAIEKTLAGVPLKWNKRELIKNVNVTDDMFNYVLDESKSVFENALAWIEAEEPEISDTERKYVMRTPSFTLTGKIDALTEDDKLVDFKTSKSPKTYAHSEQLSAYKYLIKRITDRDVTCSVVYLGDTEPIEITMPKDVLDMSLDIFRTKLHASVDLKNRVMMCEKVEATPSFICKYCDYRSDCSSATL